MLLFPGPCCLCDGALADPLGSPVCPACRSQLVASADPACPKCGRFLPAAAPDRCEACRRRRLPWRRAVSAARHQGVFRRALLELKFHRREVLAGFLAPPAIAAWRRTTPEKGPAAAPPRAVVPMPLSFWRSRRRGCNQAELLALEIARALGIPLSAGILKRRARPPQTSVSRSARRANVRGAFRARRLPPEFAGRPLLLVDDVFTTGSTAEAAARCLRRAGSGPVDVLTATRAD